jgi:3-dehydroquinate dehydratase
VDADRQLGWLGAHEGWVGQREGHWQGVRGFDDINSHCRQAEREREAHSADFVQHAESRLAKHIDHERRRIFSESQEQDAWVCVGA